MANAIVYPWAVVVHLKYADPALPAVVGAWRLVATATLAVLQARTLLAGALGQQGAREISTISKPVCLFVDPLLSCEDEKSMVYKKTLRMLGQRAG